MWLQVVRGGRVTVFKGLVLFSVGYTSHLVYRMCVEAADVVGVCLKKLAVAGSLLLPVPCYRVREVPTEQICSRGHTHESDNSGSGVFILASSASRYCRCSEGSCHLDNPLVQMY